MSSEDKHTKQPGSTTTSTSTNKKQHHGRKRPREGRDGRGTSKHEEQQHAYYDRLVHQCQKELHKQAKQTKSFLTQKLIRKLKESTSSTTSTSGSSAPSSRELQEQKLQQLKDYELEPVVEECFRRLGMRQLDPKLQKISWQAENGVMDPSKKGDQHKPEENGPHRQEQTPETSSPSEKNKKEPTNEEHADSDAATTLRPTAVALCSEKMGDSCDGWIRERILQHSRMMTALEHWNEQVTEYRRWCLQQQERAEGVWTTTSTRTKKMQAKRLPQGNNNHKDDTALVAADHSVFVMLGGDDEASASEGAAAGANGSYYGPASDGTLAMKKNRQGQRARRAKAQAVEARKTGRGFRPEESLNWRRSRKHPEHEQQQQPQQQQHSMRNKKQEAFEENPKEELHPSWQARKDKKDGIVAFEGKKIRFD